jgi:dTDP-4-dehydrorhamnose reductase
MFARKILIFGRIGQVGWELRHKLACLGTIVTLDYPDIDFTRGDSLRSAIRSEHPDVIVNAVAYTAVDKAEAEPELAMAINGAAPGILAEEAKSLGALLVHYSTDYVFDGTGLDPWIETSSPAPLNVYGSTKLAGDRAIQASGCHHLIFRTSWVYGARGSNFLLTMLRLSAENRQLRIVGDQVGAPTTSECIAQATADVLSQVLSPLGIAIDGRSGVYNLSNNGEASWFDFAQEIFALAQARLGTSRPQLTKIATADFPRPAQRPLNSRLSGCKLEQAFGVKLPAWQIGLELVLENMAEKAQMIVK